MEKRADYSKFPFEWWSTDELGQMLIEAVNVGDKEFADALKEEIKKRPNQSSAFAKQAEEEQDS